MRCFLKFVTILAVAALVIHAAERFDYLVRSDFFAGMAGDQTAMDRAIHLCEETLAKDPKHAEAMVWHGSILVFRAGAAFRSGDVRKGGELWGRGMKEMADGVALAPNRVGVLIPRGAMLLAMAPFVPESAESKELTRTGVGDYQKVYDIQKPSFDTLSGHARGELLYGLAAGYSRLGDKDHAKTAFEALLAVGKGSGHETEAREWLETGAFAERPMQCTGCHTGSNGGSSLPK